MNGSLNDREANSVFSICCSDAEQLDTLRVVNKVNCREIKNFCFLLLFMFLRENARIKS